jgi:DNA repair protein RecO (recombination protein O)
MPLLQTDALVLHVADYLESSRLLRLLTREAGVQSVVARGARSSKKRFGSAVDVTRSRAGLAADLGRFTAAAALSEVVLRIVHEEAAPTVYAIVTGGFDTLLQIDRSQVVAETVGVMWRVLAEVGFRPTLDRCAECLDPVPEDEPARFLVSAGGVLCARCARQLPGGRLLPADARRVLRAWLEPAREGATPSARPVLDEAAAKAHQRLLREFLAHHLPDARALKAWQVWEQGAW